MHTSTLARRSVFDDPVDYFRREWGKFFGPVMPGETESSRETVGAYPADIYETDKEIIVEAEVPGFEKNQLQVSLDKGLLTITGERKSEEVDGEKHLSERRYHRIQRRFQLPSSVDESKVDASLKSGVLTLEIQKKAGEERKPKMIDIK